MGKREFSLCVCVCVSFHFISRREPGQPAGRPTWKVPNLEAMHAVPASSRTSCPTPQIHAGSHHWFKVDTPNPGIHESF